MNGSMLAAVLHGARDLCVVTNSVPDLLPGQVLVRVKRAGICGSDLHYFAEGYCGSFVPAQPFILGHELAGEVAALAPDVQGPAVGTRVAVNPARPCGFCDYCKSGRGNLCRKTVMLGSASTTPPTDGAFADFVAVRADQCHVLPPQIDDGLGALLEPLSVALHAIRRSGTVSGRKVLVQGGGPIGLLVALTAQAYGANSVVVSEPLAARRDVALRLGADAVLDGAAAAAGGQAREITSEGFDLVFEASGARSALRQAFGFARPGGTIVQIGTIGTEDVPLPANEVMARELNYVGSFRYGNVFEEAIRLVASRRIDLQPFISDVFPLGQARQAIERALAKDGVLKVQLRMV